MSRILEQRRRAAALGTEVRSKRAALKRRIADEDLDLVELLQASGDVDEDAPVAEEIPIGQLLRSVPGIGPATAGEILDDLQLNPDRPMGELTPTMRGRLADEIERT